MGKSKKRAKVVEQAPVRSTADDPFAWIEGLHPLGFWQPLFNFRKESEMAKAHGTLKYILRLDSPPRELVDYEDFRVNMGDLPAFEHDPDPETQERYRSLSAQRHLEAPVRARSITEDALQPIEPSKPSESRTTCPECYMENQKRRCTRKTGHSGLHKDAKGRKWRSA